MPLSYSQLQTYRRCPKQYDFAVVKKLGRAISAGESFGSSMHNTLRRFGELEMKLSGRHEPEKPLQLFVEESVHDTQAELTLTTLLTMWRQCFIAEGYGSRAEMDLMLQRGERALTHFFRWWNERSRTVVCIEKSFKFAVLGTKDVLAGRFDRIEKTDAGLHIIDFKSSNPRPPEELVTDLQLSVYALAAKGMWPEPVSQLTLLFVTEDGVIEQSTTRSEAELQDALTHIRLLAERIDAKDYTATPSVEKCRQCPYRTICPFRAV
ncbi:MAG: PD-(D/E)XK nuclease family protein [Candidatus Peribacteraceae bacterium]|nr:PD-(D/E)XK nuclease family protein [Candidatus Peribacteraceae bacterium]MBP9850179.1 PD-(D/E)XK nuclease family protein [Candidatus Peribacteraceae bacterium]